MVASHSFLRLLHFRLISRNLNRKSCRLFAFREWKKRGGHAPLGQFVEFFANIETGMIYRSELPIVN